MYKVKIIIMLLMDNTIHDTDNKVTFVLSGDWLCYGNNECLYIIKEKSHVTRCH